MTNESLSFINCGSCFTPVLSKGKWLDERCECNWEMTNSISMPVIPWSENVVEYRNCNSGICYVMLCKAVFSCVMLLYAMLCYVTLVAQLCPALCDPMNIWLVAHQAPLSIGFSRQEYWIRLPFPSPGDLPNPGTELRSPALQADSLPSEPPGKPQFRNQLLELPHSLDVL